MENQKTMTAKETGKKTKRNWRLKPIMIEGAKVFGLALLSGVGTMIGQRVVQRVSQASHDSESNVISLRNGTM